MESRSRVVFSNTYGHANVGDEAIVHSMIADTVARLPTDVTLLSLFPERTRAQHPQVRVLHSGVTRGTGNTIRAIRDADLLVVGGGGIIQDSTSLGNLLFHFSRIAMALSTRTPYMCYAISVGPLQSRLSPVLTATMLRRASRITVRDQLSGSLLEEIGIPGNLIEVTADPVLLMDFPETIRATAYHRLAKVKQAGKAVLGISLRPAVGRVKSKSTVVSRRAEEEILLDHVAKAARRFVKAQDGHVAFYSMHPDQDDQLGMRLQKKIGSEEDYTFFPGTLSPPIMMGAVGLSDYFIGMRLHSLIFAARSNIPLVALGYAPKVHGVIQLLGQGKYVLNAADWNADTLTSSLEELCIRRTSIRDELRTAILALQRRAERNGEIMVQLLEYKQVDKQQIPG